MIKVQQPEYNEMFQAVRNAQEAQIVQIDQLTYAVERIEGHQKESENYGPYGWRYYLSGPKVRLMISDRAK